MTVTAYVLSVVSWVAISMLMVFLGRIAYFYEKTSGQRVRYYLIIVPSALLVAGAIWYLIHDVDFIVQPVGDALLFGGGLLLFLFGIRLQEFMTGERR